MIVESVETLKHVLGNSKEESVIEIRMSPHAAEELLSVFERLEAAERAMTNRMDQASQNFQGY